MGDDEYFSRRSDGSEVHIPVNLGEPPKKRPRLLPVAIVIIAIALAAVAFFVFRPSRDQTLSEKVLDLVLSRTADDCMVLVYLSDPYPMSQQAYADDRLEYARKYAAEEENLNSADTRLVQLSGPDGKQYLFIVQAAEYCIPAPAGTPTAPGGIGG